jgi:hypothetical protein
MQRIQGRLDSIGKSYMTISEPRRYANYYKEDVAYLKASSEKWQALLENLVQQVNEGDPLEAFQKAQHALEEARGKLPMVQEGVQEEEAKEVAQASPPKRRGRPPKVKDAVKDAPQAKNLFEQPQEQAAPQ